MGFTINEDYVGRTYLSKEGDVMTVLELNTCKKVTVQFDAGHTLTVQLGNLERGTIKNPYHPSVFGIGYIGIGRHAKHVKGKTTKTYEKWKSIMQRSYSKEYHSIKPTYANCSVDKKWHNFQNFGDWFEENYNPETMQGWELDKDILKKGNKIYSPETCCLVPSELNIIILKRKSKRGNNPIGVTFVKGRFKARMNKNGNKLDLGTFDTPEEAFQAYKIAKEAWIKEVADIWKTLIELRVYQAMYNYKVEITD